MFWRFWFLLSDSFPFLHESLTPFSGRACPWGLRSRAHVPNHQDGTSGFHKVSPQLGTLPCLLLGHPSPGYARERQGLIWMASLCMIFPFHRIQICSSEERVQWRYRAGFPPGVLWDAASPGEWTPGGVEMACAYGWQMDLNLLGIIQPDMPITQESRSHPRFFLPAIPSWRMQYGSLSRSCSWKRWSSLEVPYSYVSASRVRQDNALLEKLILSGGFSPPVGSLGVPSEGLTASTKASSVASAGERSSQW